MVTKYFYPHLCNTFWPLFPLRAERSNPAGSSVERVLSPSVGARRAVPLHRRVPLAASRFLICFYKSQENLVFYGLVVGNSLSCQSLFSPHREKTV